MIEFSGEVSSAHYRTLDEEIVYLEEQLYIHAKLAASHKELLRRCQELLELSEKYIPGDLFYRDNLHDELAKELDDD